MEGGALFDPGFLGGQFLWWVGQIPDDATWRDNTPPGVYPGKDYGSGWGRRYKVRIIGIHDKDEEKAAAIVQKNVRGAQVRKEIKEKKKDAEEKEF